jgi:PAS domain S-box-containing protein
MFWLFAGFLLGCAFTHALDSAMSVWPAYRFLTLAKGGTAVVSWATVACIVPVGTRALTIRGPGELQLEIDRREQVEEALQHSHAELEHRVQARTAELAQANTTLQAEIEERRRAEERVRDQRECLRVTLTSIGDAVIATDVAGRVTFINPVAEQLTGYPEESALGRRLDSIFDLVNEETGAGVSSPVATVLGEGRVVGLANHTVLRSRTGAEHPIDDSASPIRDANGQITGAVLVFRDVTEKRRTEHTLAHLAAIVESSHDAIVRTDLEGTITTWNTGAELMLGWSAEEMLGKSIEQILPPERPGELRRLRTSVRQGVYVEPFETLRLRKDGTSVEVSVSVTPLRDRHSRVIGAASIMRDISANKRLEEQMRQAQKIAAVGQLAGGVAHNFNNLLTVVISYADMLARGLPGDSPYRDFATRIVDSGERAASLTRQLLTFSRKQPVRPTVINLNRTIGNLEKILATVLGAQVRIETRLGHDLASVRADESQLEQVVLNLAINARDAMPEGGTLTIRTANVNRSDSWDRRTKPFVLLEMRDTGVGMDEATRAHVFEPFFTTKEVGKGTGLGLATVYGIVRSNGGVVEVRSERGKGATFSVYLPALSPEESAALVAAAGLAPLLRGRETVLLVEDEDGVRMLAREVLLRSGYTVLEAANGVEALQLSRGHAGPIHLMLTDVVMPQMGGLELAQLLAAERPETRTLFMSGYTEHFPPELEAGEARMLEKPFSPADLSRVIRDVLDEP